MYAAYDKNNPLLHNKYLADDHAQCRMARTTRMLRKQVSDTAKMRFLLQSTFDSLLINGKQGDVQQHKYVPLFLHETDF